MPIQLSADEITALKARIEKSNLSENDAHVFVLLLEQSVQIRNRLIEGQLSIARLKQMLHVKTETRPTSRKKKPAQSDSRPKGHGKKGANDYEGANRVFNPLNDQAVGDHCPDCRSGHLRQNPENGIFLQIDAAQPFVATIHENEKLICDTCGQIFTAKTPDTVSPDRFTPSARALLSLMKYGYGFPFYRQGSLQNCLGVPIPPSTQWDEVEKMADCHLPVLRHFEYLAANGDLLHADDTPMKIMNLVVGEKERKAVFTTGMISYNDGHQICLFYTTNRHAGENLDLLLSKRETNLPPPILMSDALSRNKPKNHPVKWTFCLTHARRKFVEIESAFPDEAEFIIETLKGVYSNDKKTRDEKMTSASRLLFHQENSKAAMDEIKNWCTDQIVSKKAEPNSSLGNAINYCLNHWKELTGFLRIEGAPLTNDILEQLLKTAILNRKNAMFYKTQIGAWVGDLIMSVIMTAKKAGANPLHYMTFVQENSRAVRLDPGAFMPWNYMKNAPRYLPVSNSNSDAQSTTTP